MSAWACLASGWFPDVSEGTGLTGRCTYQECPCSRFVDLLVLGDAWLALGLKPFKKTLCGFRKHSEHVCQCACLWPFQDTLEQKHTKCVCKGFLNQDPRIIPRKHTVLKELLFYFCTSKQLAELHVPAKNASLRRRAGVRRQGLGNGWRTP